MTKFTDRWKKGHWFSKNPNKAWSEKFFLIYSPVWIVYMGLWMTFRPEIRYGWGDVGNMVLSIIPVIPLFLYPALFMDIKAVDRKWYESYWFKMNIWIFIFSCGQYWFTEYFFDVLGMVYTFPHLKWNLDAELLGSGSQKCPVMMYIITLYFFMTYHSCSVVLMRRIRTSDLPIRIILWPIMVAACAYLFAAAETIFMASPLIEDVFYYHDRMRMIKYGSVAYGLFFIVSFPMVSRLDENPEDNWTIGRTLIEAFATIAMVLYLLDFWTKIIGRLY